MRPDSRLNAVDGRDVTQQVRVRLALLLAAGLRPVSMLQVWMSLVKTKVTSRDPAWDMPRDGANVAAQSAPPFVAETAAGLASGAAS
jgi:hypothetical protein